MSNRPLSEIVAEGRAMCRPGWQGPKGYRDTFIAEHFARLLAVAEAAMEEHGGLHADPECPICAAVARLAQEGEGRNG